MIQNLKAEMSGTVFYVSVILSSLTYVIGTAGNIVIIFALYRVRSFKTVTAGLLLHFSFASLIKSSFVIYSKIFNQMTAAKHLNLNICNLTAMIEIITTIQSAVILAMLAYARCVKVFHPKIFARTIPERRMPLIHIAVIFIAVVTSTFPLGKFSYHEFLGSCFVVSLPKTRNFTMTYNGVIVLSEVAMFFCYTKAFRNIVKHGNTIYPEMESVDLKMIGTSKEFSPKYTSNVSVNSVKSADQAADRTTDASTTSDTVQGFDVSSQKNEGINDDNNDTCIENAGRGQQSRVESAEQVPFSDSISSECADTNVLRKQRSLAGKSGKLDSFYSETISNSSIANASCIPEQCKSRNSLTASHLQNCVLNVFDLQTGKKLKGKELFDESLISEAKGEDLLEAMNNTCSLQENLGPDVDISAINRSSEPLQVACAVKSKSSAREECSNEGTESIIDQSASSTTNDHFEHEAVSGSNKQGLFRTLYSRIFQRFRKSFMRFKVRKENQIDPTHDRSKFGCLQENTMDFENGVICHSCGSSIRASSIEPLTQLTSAHYNERQSVRARPDIVRPITARTADANGNCFSVDQTPTAPRFYGTVDRKPFVTKQNTFFASRNVDQSLSRPCSEVSGMSNASKDTKSSLVNPNGPMTTAFSSRNVNSLMGSAMMGRYIRGEKRLTYVLFAISLSYTFLTLPLIVISFLSLSNKSNGQGLFVIAANLLKDLTVCLPPVLYGLLARRFAQVCFLPS